MVCVSRIGPSGLGGARCKCKGRLRRLARGFGPIGAGGSRRIHSPLRTELVHHFGSHDSVGESRKVLDIGRRGELTTGGESGMSTENAVAGSAVTPSIRQSVTASLFRSFGFLTRSVLDCSAPWINPSFTPSLQYTMNASHLHSFTPRMLHAEQTKNTYPLASIPC